MYITQTAMGDWMKSERLTDGVATSFTSTCIQYSTKGKLQLCSMEAPNVLGEEKLTEVS